MHKELFILAFVVGAKIGDIEAHRVYDSGGVDVVTHGTLVDTAKTELFGLKDRLEEHYNYIGDECLVEKALREPAQISLVDYKFKS